MNFKDILRQTPIALFPRFEAKQAGVAHNVLYLASWSLISTLPYLDFALASDDADWTDRYGRVQLAFQEGLGRGPGPVVQAWPLILRHVFQI